MAFFRRSSILLLLTLICAGFARAQSGDVVMAISGSGNSPNVLSAVEFANGAGCKTIALTGRDGGKLGSLAQLNIQVPVQHMGRIEDAHLIICHMIAYNFMENGSTQLSS